MQLTSVFKNHWHLLLLSDHNVHGFYRFIVVPTWFNQIEELWTPHTWHGKSDTHVRETSGETNVVMLNNENRSSSDGNI